ncbi:MAG: 2-C-methyl-D-erythritol 2,4-cyclodiphosphate synthase [Bacteroidota bacterium]
MGFNIRVGMGYDVHQLTENRELWLGGVLIPHTHGALGHSDADVLLHALCDALLGAASLRDIGFHYSDKDARWKGIDSKLLLADVVKKVAEAGWKIGNADMTLMLEAPKIAPHVEAMQQCIASILGVENDCVSVKATTGEKMGFVGRQEGVEAQAVVLLYRD